ncbi:hypothetical protein BC351_08360 [Paenibacillus ferrarius]|uniref:Uncharacterized protein n=2 Tax=Paenibacillus ferrarius TaxID=1469647 RepID=A0A1V4HBE0_9BACL|nr:hypothetical protein BC351_08360 [Paenibacillus ferrarius]
MTIDEIRELLTNRYPHWNIYLGQSGVAIWIDMNDGDTNFFIIQVTPKDGVGISLRREVDGLDFSGHDRAFKYLDEALDYMDKEIYDK